MFDYRAFLSGRFYILDMEGREKIALNTRFAGHKNNRKHNSSALNRLSQKPITGHKTVAATTQSTQEKISMWVAAPAATPGVYAFF